MRTSEDDHLGIPTGGSVETLPPRSRPVPEPSGVEPEAREGDTGLGRPDQVPDELAPLTDEERAILAQLEAEELEREIAEAERALTSEPALMGLRRSIIAPLAAVVVFGFGGALGLFLFSQTLSILANLAAQPEWVRYLGYGGLVLLAACVLYAITRLGVFYMRLKRNQQVRLEGVEELAKRTRLRWLARAKTHEAKRKMEDYLRSFPLEAPNDRRVLLGLGMTEETLRELQKARDTLLDPDKFSTTDQWFVSFTGTFQKHLDDVATARVQYWARRTGVITALAPNGLVDSAATLYFSFALLGDLCRIYHLRAGSVGTTVLLANVFFNAYLAGQGTEVEHFAEQSLESMFAPSGPLGEALAARLVAKVGSKAASGALNYFLLRRLGRFSVRLLKPVG